MKKEIASLVLGLTLASTSLFSQNFLPERFKDYREKSLYQVNFFLNYNGELFNVKAFYLNSDPIADVQELYPCERDSRGNIKPCSKEPLLYTFNLNGNEKWEEGEWFFDPEMDGLNDNELPLNQYLEKKKVGFSRKQIEL